jgi:xanthine dehydrogenase YagS FAD-binding subunit
VSELTYELLQRKTVDEVLLALSKYWGERKPLEHFNAKTIDEAISLLDNRAEGAKVIAGGTDLIRLMKNEVIAPKVLVNIKTIPGLANITEDAKGLKIGALATIKEIESSPMIRSKYPLLADTAHSVASPHIRNMATLAGNLCQEVNCWYYRRSPVTGKSFHCRRKGGEQCFAVTGDNRHHAIIGGNKCYAVCPSDMAIALSVLGAKVKIASPDGRRELSLDKLHIALGDVLKPNEIIIEIRVPALMPNTKQRFLKFRVRKTIDFAISSVAAVVTTEDGVVSRARIVLGGVAPTPYRALDSEEIIQGKVITESVANRAAKAAVSEALPLSMNAYKVPMTKALVKRAIFGFI